MTDPFEWRHYESEIILTCVRWYLRYSLSYRDLTEMMTERGLSVDHSTIFRWVQDYAPAIDNPSSPDLITKVYLGDLNRRCGSGILDDRTMQAQSAIQTTAFVRW